MSASVQIGYIRAPVYFGYILLVSIRFNAKSSKYHKFLLAFYGIFKNYRIFIIPNLGVLYILQKTETIRIPLVSRLLPVLFRQTPNFLIFDQSLN